MISDACDPESVQNIGIPCVDVHNQAVLSSHHAN